MRGVRVLRARNAEPPDLLFDCSRVLEYTKIRTVLQSTIFPNVCLWRRSLCSDLVLTLKNLKNLHMPGRPMLLQYGPHFFSTLS